MSANHYFTATQQLDPRAKNFGKWVVIDWIGEGITVAGPFEDPMPARQEALDLNNAAPAHQLTEIACRACGCTENDACVDDFGRPCHWVEADLCSSCQPALELNAGRLQ